METITFNEMILLLKNREQPRREIFKKVRNINNGSIPFIYHYGYYTKKDFLKTKKIYYKYQIKRKLNNLKEEDISFLNAIYNEYVNKKLIINEEVKSKINYYFGRSSSVGRLLAANYYYVSDKISLDSALRKVVIFDDVDGFLSKVISERTRNKLRERGIVKVSDLKNKNVFLNQIEYSNVCRYLDDLKKYYLNDTLFLSILNNDERKLFDQYLMYNSYLLLSEEMKLSPTEVRARIYTVIKKMLKFFDSIDGIRVLDLIFSKNDCFVTLANLKEIFPKYHQYLIYLVKNKFLYKIEFINGLDIIKIK